MTTYHPMITIERTFDHALVRRIFTAPKVYKFITDDFSPDSEDYKPVEHPDLVYLVASNGQPFGAGMFIPRNAVCFEVHLGFLPSGWGLAEKTAKLAIGWIFSNTRCQRVFASIPEYNRLTLRLAKSAGMEEFGVNKASFLKDGKLRDQILMGLSKRG